MSKVATYRIDGKFAFFYATMELAQAACKKYGLVLERDEKFMDVLIQAIGSEYTHQDIITIDTTKDMVEQIMSQQYGEVSMLIIKSMNMDVLSIHYFNTIEQSFTKVTINGKTVTGTFEEVLNKARPNAVILSTQEVSEGVYKAVVKFDKDTTKVVDYIVHMCVKHEYELTHSNYPTTNNN